MTRKGPCFSHPAMPSIVAMKKQGMTNKEIGRELGLSANWVDRAVQLYEAETGERLPRCKARCGRRTGEMAGVRRILDIEAAYAALPRCPRCHLRGCNPCSLGGYLDHQATSRQETTSYGER